MELSGSVLPAFSGIKERWGREETPQKMEEKGKEKYGGTR